MIHLLLRLVEPKVRPQSSPESLEFFVTDQACIKANYLYIFNNGLVRASNMESFLDAVNFNCIDEDTYLEVKMLKEDLGVDAWVQTQKKSHGYTPATIDKVLAVLSLKFDEDKEVQQ